ncbi:Zinc finger protein 91-like, partial [Plakobranchus ocellatus]
MSLPSQELHKMDLIDTSSHMCLICNQTVIGLYNYVEHFKSHATAQESKLFEDNFLSEKDKPGPEASHSNGGKSKAKGKPDRDLTSGPSSPLCELPDGLTDPDMETGAALDQNNIYPDFFQSLELKSTSEEAPPKAKMKAVQRLSILEDDAQAELLLPITTILSNLDFSSDDDFFELSEDEEGDENTWFDDEGESLSHPPPGHTGGKWKPGEGPKRRMPIAGKRRPGQKPGPACRKNILRKPAKVKSPKAEVGKSFYCNVCHSFFMDRSVYSLHFGQSRHQEMAAAKKQESNLLSSFNDETATNIGSSETQGAKTAVSSDFYCQDCKLYFNNAVVFATHCETKLHKDAVLKQGFREVRGGGGAIYRINVNTDTVHKERQEKIYPALGANKKNKGKQQQGETGISTESNETHECPICVKYFTRKYEMARHLLTRMHAARARHHPEAASVKMLERYNKYMVRLMPFQCAVCSFYFNRQKDFLDHMGSTGHLETCEDMLGPIVCVPCKFKTHKHDEMMEHLQCSEHYAAVEKKYGVCVVKESHTRITCKFCGVRMHSAVRMKQHCARKHQDRMSHMELTLDTKPLEQVLHKCPLCEKSFKARSLLQLHFLKMMEHLQCSEHYSAVEKKYGVCVVKESHTRITCKFCGVRMHSAVRMKQHCARKHQDRMSHMELTLDTKPLEQVLHKCPLCEKSFKARSLLQLHFLKVHKHKYLFNCTVCKRGFLDQRRLDNHLRTRFHAKRVIASKINGNKGSNYEGSLMASHAQRKGASRLKQMPSEKAGTEQRRSGRKRKMVKFFDSDGEGEQETGTLEPKKNCKKSKSPLMSMAKQKASQSKRTKPMSEIGKKDLEGQVGNKRKTLDSGTEETNIRLKRSVERVDNHDEDIEKLHEHQRLSAVEREAIHAQEEEEDEDMILEEEAEEDEGEIIAGNEEEVEKEEYARVNEASLTIFSCTYCEFAATDLLELRAHYSGSHPQEILTCQPCDQCFLSLKAYKIHCSGRGHQLKLREMSGETTIHKCRLCDKRFLQEFSCKLHLETVHRHPSSEEDLRRLHKGQDLVTQLYGEHVKQ